jgi:phosphatidylserine/phosphatidylglycerophosphate/cardiolipin synthase-like enzyme
MIVAGRRGSRWPFGNSTHNLQDQAFLVAIRHAQRRIRIQTPNLNDDAVREAIIHAAQRGVTVQLVLSKGFNAVTESLPGQGG